MPKSGPRTTYKYSDEFKATAVRLSELPDVAVQDVARSLAIHPFMLSRWRKDVRDGKLMAKKVDLDKDVAAELKELRAMKKKYERLQLEHDILKKAIEYTSKQKATSSDLSKRTKKSSR
ncbi:MAG: transposase [Pseudomonadota bacterium]